MYSWGAKRYVVHVDLASCSSPGTTATPTTADQPDKTLSGTPYQGIGGCSEEAR